jgi:large subunit ribosomal protein L21
MYAIVQIGANQYKVSKGDVITADRIDQKQGKAVNFEKVILFNDGKKDLQIGKPFIKGFKVSAEVLRHLQGRKSVAFKYQRRKHYFKKHGHRQQLTELLIKDISEK